MLKFRTFLFLREEEEEHYKFHDNGPQKGKYGPYHTYHFKANKGHYEVSFSPKDQETPHSENLVFSHLSDARKQSFLRKNQKGKHRVYKDLGMNKSAGLDARKILHTVHAIARHHVTNNPHIKEIGFSGRNNSRIKAYDNMIRKHNYNSQVNSEDKYEDRKDHEKDWTIKVR